MGMVTTWLNSPNLLGLPSVASLSLKDTHHGMMPITSAVRWPPDLETAPITGQNLVETIGITLRAHRHPNRLLIGFNGRALRPPFRKK